MTARFFDRLIEIVTYVLAHPGVVAYDIAILAIVLGVLVFVHELGHYLAAKSFGVWVHRFAIGIGKPIPGLTFRRGETEWAIAWLPLGGYVKMASREADPASSVLEGGSDLAVPPDRVFEAKPVWQRMVIILAGVALNSVFAFLIFTGLAWKNGRRYDPTTTLGRVVAAGLPREAAELATVPRGTRLTAIDGHKVSSWDDIVQHILAGSSNQIVFSFDGHANVVVPIHRDALATRDSLASPTAINPTQMPVLGAVTPDTPARAAGLEAGDSIIAIDGAPIVWWSDAVDLIEPAAGRALQIDVMRGGVRRRFTVTPRAEHRIPDDSASPMIGRIGVVTRVAYRTEPLSIGGAIVAGAEGSVSAAGTIFRTLRGLANGRVAASQLGGPILISQMAAEEARAGVQPLLAFIALISINLAVINLMPIPVLDGGAFLFLLAEGILRRPLPGRVREALSIVGLVLIVLLMAVAFKNDIMRPGR